MQTSVSWQHRQLLELGIISGYPLPKTLKKNSDLIALMHKNDPPILMTVILYCFIQSSEIF